jgi:hypothetical protein
MMLADFLEFPDCRIIVKFYDIPLAEFLESFGFVPEPLAQVCGWRDILHPLVKRRTFLRDTAWPQAIHQHPIAVRVFDFVIYSLDMQ